MRNPPQTAKPSKPPFLRAAECDLQNGENIELKHPVSRRSLKQMSMINRTVSLYKKGCKVKLGPWLGNMCVKKPAPLPF